MPTIRRILIDLSVMVAVGLLLALIGPFGSFTAPFPLRLLYWVGLALLGYAIYRPLAGLVVGASDRLDLPLAAMWVAGCLIGTVPMTAAVWMIGHIANPRWPGPIEAVTQYGYVLIIGAGVTALFYVLRRPPVTEAPDEPAAPSTDSEAEVGIDAAATPRFFERLPPHLRRDLLALEMEDHYVRAHTAAGSTLILMRLRDAVAELDGLEGAQVHRSWWVAKRAVQSVRRDGRNVRLILGEIEAPVARGSVTELERMGWLG